MADEFDPFALSTGLPDTLDITIDEAWFEFDPQYNDGQTLVLKFNVSATDEEFGEGGKGMLMYPCGSGWTAEDRGGRAVRQDGNERKGFNNGSAYGLFINAALECDGAEKVLREEGRGDPRKAAMWAGLSFHLDRKEKNYGGEIGKVSRLLPTSFLGAGGAGKATGAAKKVGGPTAKAPVPSKAAAPAKKAGPVAKAAPTAVEELPADEGAGAGGFDESHPLYATLYAMALAAADHDSFMEEAFSSVEGVNGDEVVEAAVMDTSPDSMWAKAVAEYEASQG